MRSLFLLFFLCAQIVHSAEFPVAAAKGNAAYAAGDFQGAAEAYQDAMHNLEGQAPPPELFYNLGTALLASGASGEGMDALEEAAARSPSPQLRSLCRYNIGTSLAAQAQAGQHEDPDGALPLFQAAVDQFRAALLEKPQFEDAAVNLEIALRQQAKLKKEREEEDQKKDKQDPSDDGDPGDDSESDEDEEYSDDEMNSETDLFDAAEALGEFSDYDEVRGVPPPNRNEMDILEEELQNQKKRKAKSGAYKAVERDW